MSLNEAIVEDAALTWFGELGYTVIHGPQLPPGESAAERDSLGDVVLAGRLRKATYLWNLRQDAEAMYTESWRAFVREKYGTDAIVTYFESPVTVDNLTEQVIGD